MMITDEQIQQQIDMKTKPFGSLGKLEAVAAQIARAQKTLSPQLAKPTMLVFAGDHGLALEGCSPSPQEVTHQMVMNFLSGGAAINIFCKAGSIDLKVIDAGVNYDFKGIEGLIDKKIAYGSRSCLSGPAMTDEQCRKALDSGAECVKREKEAGCNIIGFGEMGIGNTSLSSLIMSCLLDIPLEECIGRGAGSNEKHLEKKRNLLMRSLEKNGKPESPEVILATYGGFEIAMICGAMKEAARRDMIIMVDGFISTAANMLAIAMESKVRDYSLYTHCSNEAGHLRMLQHLKADPLLDLNLRLGEGTGAALAWPLIKSSVAFFNEMASFDSSGVSSEGCL